MIKKLIADYLENHEIDAETMALLTRFYFKGAKTGDFWAYLKTTLQKVLDEPEPGKVEVLEVKPNR